MVVVSEGIEDQLPSEYAELFGITTLVCTPLSAAGRAYGVICADRGGGRFELTDGERHLLWTLGKTAALVATARNATRQQERNRRLGERLELAREIHERVMQRLFGVSLALSAEKPLDRGERDRCLVGDAGGAQSDLRSALERPLAPVSTDTGTTLAAEVARLVQAPGPQVQVDLARRGRGPRRASSRWPSRCWPRRCATSPSTPTPSVVEVVVAGDEDTFSLEVRNDGVAPRRPRRRDGAPPGGVRSAPARRRGGLRRARGGRCGGFAWSCR